MTADRHRPLQALQQCHRTTQFLDEGDCQTNLVSAVAVAALTSSTTNEKLTTFTFAESNRLFIYVTMSCINIIYLCLVSQSC